MLHPVPSQFVVLDGGLERSLDAWDPPRRHTGAALMTPRGAIDGRLLLYERVLEFRPAVDASRTRVVIRLDEIVSVQRALVVLARRKPLALALRVTVAEHREVRFVVSRPNAWIESVKRGIDDASAQPRTTLRAAPDPGQP